MDKIAVGILGATGIVGQTLVWLLADHPWFKIAFLASSDRSAGKRYADACRWLLSEDVPTVVRDFVVEPLDRLPDCQLVFSALPADIAGPVEEHLANSGYAVCSNASIHRLERDVPLIVPEVNAGHAVLIETQRKRRGGRGFIVTNPNCSAGPLSLILSPLHAAFGVRRVSVVTMQAVSGAGYPGIPTLDIMDNLIPYIEGEEEKIEKESRKILGRVGDGKIEEASVIISAQCNRVAVPNGHTECVAVAFDRPPEIKDAVAVLEGFRPSPEVARLPMTPPRPIVLRTESDRPQPVRDRWTGRGMSVVVGRLRSCGVLDLKFVLHGHNTIRGAAGGTIQIGELLVAQGWLG